MPSQLMQLIHDAMERRTEITVQGHTAQHAKARDDGHHPQTPTSAALTGRRRLVERVSHASIRSADEHHCYRPCGWAGSAVGAIEATRRGHLPCAPVHGRRTAVLRGGEPG